MEEFPSEDTSGIESVESGVLRAGQDQGEDNSSHESCGETSATERDHQFTLNDLDQEGQQDEDQPEIKLKALSEQFVWTEGEAAEAHEKKLLKELKKLSEQSLPSRNRLAVFSDVFDDVCEGLPVFGRILREIKADYDFYITHLTVFQLPNVLNKDIDKAKEIELVDAEEEIYILEEEVKNAQEENKRVLQEWDDTSTTESSDNDEMNGSTLSLRDSKAAISDTSGIQIKRLELLNVWKEIQELEKEIEEKTVPVAITSATETQIRDMKSKVVRLIASNDRLRIIIKDEVDGINAILTKEKSSKATRRMLWEDIYNEIDLNKK